MAAVRSHDEFHAAPQQQMHIESVPPKCLPRGLQHSYCFLRALHGFGKTRLRETPQTTQMQKSEVQRFKAHDFLLYHHIVRICRARRDGLA